MSTYTLDQHEDGQMNENNFSSLHRPRLRRKDVPAYLAEKHGIPVALATLCKLATIGGGPVMQYSGRIPLYHVDDLDAWAQARLSKPVKSTAERGVAA